MRIVLLVFAASVAWAQPPRVGDTIFPSDTRDPRQVGGAELLEAVCPGAVETGKGISCVADCPPQTDFAGEHMSRSLEAVTFGHFRAPTSDDAVLWIAGCESHSANFGGAVLLTRILGKWSMVWYKSGIVAERCHKVLRRDRRDILVCLGTYGGQGITVTDLYVEDFLNPKPTLMAGGADDGTFFEVSDNTANCGSPQVDDAPGPDPVIRGHIDAVQFTRRGGMTIVSVAARSAEKTFTRREAAACRSGDSDVLPSAKKYSMEFQYDGASFKPTASSIPFARIFQAR